MTGRHNRQLAGWLLLVVTFLIVYGSLYPFRFAAVESQGLLDLLRQLPMGRTTRSDIAANVLLYLPFGACLGWILAARVGGPLAVAGATLAGLLLSTSVEVAQIFETRRVASLIDLGFNGVGALVGAGLALALRSARHGFGRRSSPGLLAEPIALALVLLWAGYRLAPFALTLDPAQWRAALAPLRDLSGLTPLAVAAQLVPWLVVGQATRVLRGQGNPLPWLAGVMLGVLAGLVVTTGKSLSTAELAAMLLALALYWPLWRMPPGQAALLLAWLLAALVVVGGLAPFDFRVDRDDFGLVPFGDALTRYRATNLVDMFHKCFLYGALAWLLVRSGRRPVAATLLGAGLVLAVEVAQAWLPGKLADITDPLLMVAAGGLVAMFDAPLPGRSSRDWKR